jgi:hypothetical protein
MPSSHQLGAHPGRGCCHPHAAYLGKILFAMSFDTSREYDFEAVLLLNDKVAASASWCLYFLTLFERLSRRVVKKYPYAFYSVISSKPISEADWDRVGITKAQAVLHYVDEENERGYMQDCVYAECVEEGHKEKSWGHSEASARRSLALLKENCPCEGGWHQRDDE